ASGDSSIHPARRRSCDRRLMVRANQERKREIEEIEEGRVNRLWNEIEEMEIGAIHALVSLRNSKKNSIN
ncbi:hypothetical protein LL965_14940, partial [Xanthomonas cassavae CFBP 4642]